MKKNEARKNPWWQWNLRHEGKNETGLFRMSRRETEGRIKKTLSKQLLSLLS